MSQRFRMGAEPPIIERRRMEVGGTWRDLRLRGAVLPGGGPDAGTVGKGIPTRWEDKEASPHGESLGGTNEAKKASKGPTSGRGQQQGRAVLPLWKWGHCQKWCPNKVSTQERPQRAGMGKAVSAGQRRRKRDSGGHSVPRKLGEQHQTLVLGPGKRVTGCAAQTPKPWTSGPPFSLAQDPLQPGQEARRAERAGPRSMLARSRGGRCPTRPGSRCRANRCRAHGEFRGFGKWQGGWNPTAGGQRRSGPLPRGSGQGALSSQAQWGGPLAHRRHARAPCRVYTGGQWAANAADRGSAHAEARDSDAGQHRVASAAEG